MAHSQIPAALRAIEMSGWRRFMRAHERKSIGQRISDLVTRISRASPRSILRILVLPIALSLGVVAYTVSQTIVHTVSPASGPAASQAIGRADVHIYNSSVELNLSITRTENACQTPLNGQFCLRYSVVVDERAVQVGYGLIPRGAVRMTGSNIILSTDTKTNRFHHVVGPGGPISVTWTEQPGSSSVAAANQTSSLSPAWVQGTVIGQALTGPGLEASVLLYGTA
jgi:hypothetical protein